LSFLVKLLNLSPNSRDFLETVANFQKREKEVTGNKVAILKSFDIRQGNILKLVYIKN